VGWRGTAEISRKEAHVSSNLSPDDKDWRDDIGGFTGLAHRFAKAQSAPRAASIAVITNEADDLFITLGSGDHTSQRWKLTPSLARKLRRELNERLD
jgi:hypothetical protein